MLPATISILHLEDSKLDAEFVRHRLQRGEMPFDIDQVDDRKNFEAKLKSKSYDLILSDYQVPTFEGLQALDLARQYQPETPFIFVSGAMGEEFAVETLRRGATDYVLKQNLARLPSAIERAVKEARKRAELTAAEVAKRESEERLRFAHEAAKLGVWELDLVSGEILCSDMCKANLGLPSDASLTESKLLSAIHSDDRRRVEHEIRRSIETSSEYDIEYRVVFPNDEIHWLNVRGRMVSSNDGRPPRMAGISLDITDRKQTEQALQRSESHLHAIIDNHPECVKVIDQDGTVLRMNPAGVAIAEIDSVAAAIGTNIYHLIAPEFRNAYRAFNERVCGGQGGQFEYDVITSSGTRLHLESTAVPIKSSSGEFVHLAITRDVTARKQMEQELAESESKFRQLANAIPNLAWMARSDGSIFWYNDRWYEYTGSCFADTEGWGWQKLHDPNYLPSVLAAWQESLATETPFEMVFPLRGADGVFRPFLTRVIPRRGESGRILYWFGTNTDISAQKQAEEQLVRLATAETQRAELLKRLASASRTVNAVLSLDGIIHVIAEEARSIVDAHIAIVTVSGEVDDPQASYAVVATDETDRRKYSDDVQGKVSANDAELIVPLLSHIGKKPGQIRVIRKERVRFTDEDEAVLIQLAAIAAISVENARLYQSLTEQDKRKDEFLATLAHELRNPLAPIRNGLAVLRLDPNGDGLLEMMERQLNQMVHLVDDLLDVSRVTTGKIVLKPVRVDIRTIIESAVETSRPAFEAAKHELKIRLPGNYLAVEVDRVRMAQVLTNLLTNAAKYTPARGLIELMAEQVGNKVVVQVADSGIGIPAEMLPKIFDIFTQVGSTLDRSQGGLGIGLTLVRRLVEMHRGTVEASSPGLGKGSTFTIKLPVSIATNGAATNNNTSQEKIAIHNQRVLVVDDNRDAAISTAMMLKLLGGETATAHDGIEAIEAVKSFKPQIVLMDVGMPRMNGYEASRQIRQMPDGDQVVIIALTGWGQDVDRNKSRDAGCNGHLVKPVELSQLVSLLTDLAREKTNTNGKID